MAFLPSPPQVAGSHYHVYETYFNHIEQQGTVPAVEAARFLKTSGLSDAILSKIWDLSDPNGKGYLNKVGLFVALKLVALAQMGYEISLMHVLLDVPAPKFEMPLSNIPRRDSHSTSDWAMTPLEKLKYEQLFESLQPMNGVIPGNKVKGLLIDSKLPVATLGKIWDLADMDKDGSLDKHEFIVAMHLVYKALEKYAIPNSLPLELLPPGHKDSKPLGNQLLNNGGSLWVVSPDDKLKFDNLFVLADVDKDGYVSGSEIKDVFLRSGLPQPVLANIWSLCDLKQSGKLNAEQFALAMWFIQKKVQTGIDPPLSLTPEMIPPSMRSQMTHDVSNTISNPELDMISTDIDDLSKEKHILEAEILQKEAEIKIKSSEAKSLQGELDTLAATLKQLENQKGEAQKRLNDLKNQVEKLRRDAEEQEALVKTQEQELMSKKQELENLKIEESRLSSQQSELNQKLNVLGNSLQDSQLNISMVKTKIIEIQEHQFQLKEAISSLDTALSLGDSAIPQRQLEVEPEFRDPQYTRIMNQDNSTLSTNETEGKKLNNLDIYNQNGFGDDPFAASTQFSMTFSKSSKMGFDTDPFISIEAQSNRQDPFDPFEGKRLIQSEKLNEDSNRDPFGCEPFGVPAPALPPKNKQPPPRPAPPRPSAPPSHTQTSDSFADFANFNSKSIAEGYLDIATGGSTTVPCSKELTTEKVSLQFEDNSVVWVLPELFFTDPDLIPSADTELMLGWKTDFIDQTLEESVKTELRRSPEKSQQQKKKGFLKKAGRLVRKVFGRAPRPREIQKLEEERSVSGESENSGIITGEVQPETFTCQIRRHEDLVGVEPTLPLPEREQDKVGPSVPDFSYYVNTTYKD